MIFICTIFKINILTYTKIRLISYYTDRVCKLILYFIKTFAFLTVFLNVIMANITINYSYLKQFDCTIPVSSSIQNISLISTIS